MIRATLYLVASGIIWLIEGFLFSYLLRFALWQTAVMAVVYVGLFLLAVRYLLLLNTRRAVSENGLAPWRYLSLAPMVTVIVGSFASLPLLLVILALGHL